MNGALRPGVKMRIVLREVLARCDLYKPIRRPGEIENIALKNLTVLGVSANLSVGGLWRLPRRGRAPAVFPLSRPLAVAVKGAGTWLSGNIK
jgi:hypothetical protein